MSVRKSLYMQSGTLRGVFFVIIILCILAMVLYTNKLVDDLREETREILEFYAQTYQHIASETLSLDSETLSWFFINITQKTNFPLVLTDPQRNPNSWKDIGVPDNDRSPETLKQVRHIVDKLGKDHTPVEILWNGEVLNYLYYGDSKLIMRLTYLPYITLSGLGLLILTAFLGFNSIKQSEQRFIWVGMAKETAHQLGTPISSLLGWLEIMKSNKTDPKKIQRLINDFESDIRRLEKVAARFSQIGSKSALKVQDMHIIIKDTVAYFERRLPQLGKEIKIIESFGEVPTIPLNRDLFEWAIENLLKNAIDAVKQKKGIIEIKTGLIPENNKIFIDIMDNGIGINGKRRRDVFKAGYSTKKRGWGLGLNFTKRIVEDYHGGKLFIKDSHPSRGTTMRIII